MQTPVKGAARGLKHHPAIADNLRCGDVGTAVSVLFEQPAQSDAVPSTERKASKRPAFSLRGASCCSIMVRRSSMRRARSASTAAGAEDGAGME